MYENVIPRFVELPTDWSYIGLLCFTEIENRDVLKEHLPELNDQELEVLDTELLR